MVDFSLKKARNNWKNISGSSSPKKQSRLSSPAVQPPTVLPVPESTKGKSSYSKKGQDQKKKTNKTNGGNGTNPYAGLDMSKPYTELPKVNAHEKNKAASSMHRRLSMYSSNNHGAPPAMDYSIPLPTSIPGLPNMNNSQLSLVSSINLNRSVPNLNSTLEGTATRNDMKTSNENNVLDEDHFREIIQPNNLRLLLSNDTFNAKTFVRTHLSNASAMDIDQFTTVLNELSQTIQVEVKGNINRSYKEILQVNRDLTVATEGLKTLRENMQNLNNVMTNFTDMADRRLAWEESKNNAGSSTPSLLLPATGNGPNNDSSHDMKRDRSNVYIRGKMWNKELIELEKEIEGTTKFLETKGRHLMIKSEDWYELNATTLRYLQTVRLYIFNDVVLITGKNKNSDYVLKQTFDLKECTVKQDIRNENRLIFKSSNNDITSLYESRNPREIKSVLDTIRKAKDDLCDIFQSEMQNEEKLRESFRYLQSTQQQQQTPSKDISMSKSPSRNPRYSLNSNIINDSNNNSNSNLSKGDVIRSYKINNKLINYNDLLADQHLLQSLTISMRTNMRSSGMGSYTNQLLALDSLIEEVDITIARSRFAKAVSSLLEIRRQLIQMLSHLNEIEANFLELLMIKINIRCDTIHRKLVTNLTTNNEITQLLVNVSTMIELGKAEEGLELLLQNRSTLIQDLILQIGSFDNPTNFLTQLSVIRFQTMKQTVLNYKELFKVDQSSSMITTNIDKISKELSSILVNWCNVEVDKHFELINEQLLNDEMISPSSIKSSRKQIDELKSVGLDFVYKLDEFIRSNNHRIG